MGQIFAYLERLSIITYNKKMKLLIYILLYITLQANEFPLVQPFAVERASQETTPTVNKELAPPKKKQIKKIKAAATTNTQELAINFPPEGEKLTKKAKEVLQKFADYLRANPSYQAVIYVYCNHFETNKKNFELSQKRANNIVQLLESFKINSTRLTAIGGGKVEGKENKTESLIIQ